MIKLLWNTQNQKKSHSKDKEIKKKEDLEIYAKKLEANNVHVSLGNSSYSDKRFVKDLIHFNDPQGNRVELVYSPMKDNEPFLFFTSPFFESFKERGAINFCFVDISTVF